MDWLLIADPLPEPARRPCLRRSQVARLEGVEALPLPRNLAVAQSEEPPVSLQAGACHADR